MGENSFKSNRLVRINDSVIISSNRDFVAIEGDRLYIRTFEIDKEGYQIDYYKANLVCVNSNSIGVKVEKQVEEKNHSKDKYYNYHIIDFDDIDIIILY